MDTSWLLFSLAQKRMLWKTRCIRHRTKDLMDAGKSSWRFFCCYSHWHRKGNFAILGASNVGRKSSWMLLVSYSRWCRRWFFLILYTSDVGRKSSWILLSCYSRWCKRGFFLMLDASDVGRNSSWMLAIAHRWYCIASGMSTRLRDSVSTCRCIAVLTNRSIAMLTCRIRCLSQDYLE